jgi:hypothetical protein
MKSFATLSTLAVMLATATPIWADHNSAPPAADAERAPGSMTTVGSLNLDLKLGLNGFRLGSRLFGRDGYAGGAWLNGETRADGFSLDGRLERDGRAHNFKMNIDLDEWLRRAARWWTRGATDL